MRQIVSDIDQVVFSGVVEMLQLTIFSPVSISNKMTTWVLCAQMEQKWRRRKGMLYDIFLAKKTKKTI
jgi:hypothetical protein